MVVIRENGFVKLRSRLNTVCGINTKPTNKIMNRPTAVTVFGILNIVFAVFGIVGVFASVMLFAAVGTDTKNPVVQIIHDNAAYAAWMKLCIGLGLVVSAALLTAGIGLLKLKPWARIVSIAYAVYGIVMVVVGGVVNYFFLVQPMLAQAHTQQGPAAAAAIGGAVGGTVGSCFGLIYPVLLLIFMLRADVKAAFGPVASQPMDDLPPTGQP
jgi:hypothetical protein